MDKRKGAHDCFEEDTLSKDGLECMLRAMRLKHGEDADHGDIAKILSDLGTVLYKEHNYTESEEYFQEALLMYRVLYGDQHSQVARVLYLLAQGYQANNQLVQASNSYKQALGIYQALGPNSTKLTIARILEALCVISRTQMDTVAADAYARQSLEAYAALGRSAPSHLLPEVSLNDNAQTVKPVAVTVQKSSGCCAHLLSCFGLYAVQNEDASLNSTLQSPLQPWSARA